MSKPGGLGQLFWQTDSRNVSQTIIPACQGFIQYLYSNDQYEPLFPARCYGSILNVELITVQHYKADFCLQNVYSSSHIFPLETVIWVKFSPRKFTQIREEMGDKSHV